MRTRFAACLLVLALAPSAHAADAPTFSLLVENDSLIAGDRHYTSGISAAWTSAAHGPDAVTAFAENLMLPGDGAWRHGYFLGQSIFTPENLSAINPPLIDRPYAGWLFGGARLYRDSGNILDRIELSLGVVGPASLAGDVMKWWHTMGITQGADARGWHTQLPNEPGLMLSEQRIWRVTLADGPFEAEILPQANISLGNVFTHAGAGGSFRIGQGLKSDWGPPRITPALQGAHFQTVERFSWYAFAGVEGRAVGRNIFLDGSSFQSSRSVAKYNFVSDLQGGIALLWPSVRVTATVTHRGAEFRNQRGDDEFGSITVSFVP